MLPPINCRDSGNRNDNDEDLRRIASIICMHRTDFPLDTLDSYYGLIQQGDKTIEARKEMLVEQREQLIAKVEEIQKTLELVDHKLEIYNSILLKRKKNCSYKRVKTPQTSDAGETNQDSFIILKRYTVVQGRKLVTNK